MSLTHTLPSGLTVVAEDTFDWFVMAEVFMSQEYAYDGLLASRAYQPLRIVDLGCNVGYFSLWIADRLLRTGDDFLITAIDASVENLTKYKARVWAQPTLQDRVRFHWGLLGKREGHETFAENQNHAMNRLAKDVPELAGMRVTTELAYVDLDRLLGPSDIDLLKCDIEGSEGDLIEAYPKVFERTGQAVFEFHKTLVDVDACRKRLRAVGLYPHVVLRDDETLMVQVFARR